MNFSVFKIIPVDNGSAIAEINSQERLMLSDSAMMLLCIYLYTLCMGDVRSVYVTSAGLWWEGRYRSAAEAASNIVLNIVLGKYFGISGIIVATILSMLAIDFGYGTTILRPVISSKQT